MPLSCMAVGVPNTNEQGESSKLARPIELSQLSSLAHDTIWQQIV
jgi:hypothetical protein